MPDDELEAYYWIRISGDELPHWLPYAMTWSGELWWSRLYWRIPIG